MSVKFTNKHNLPESFVNAILVDDHIVSGDISVTQLIDAPQIRQLKRSNEYEMDVMDMIGMVFGTGTHLVLERGDLAGSVKAKTLQKASGILLELGEEKGAKWVKKVIEDKLKENIDSDVVTEQTLTMEVNGYTISGTFDRLTISQKLLEDYKTTSASSVMFPETKKSWNAQLNIYAMLLRHNGYEVEAARIIAILKDWSKMKTKSDKSYPKVPVIMHDIPLLDEDTVMDYIEKRVSLHQRADKGEFIPCTKKDRWAKADTFAVKKKTGKRALKLHPSRSMAEAWIEQEGFKYKSGELIVEHRKAESFRCANGYCAVSEFCPQYKRELMELTEGADEM